MSLKEKDELDHRTEGDYFSWYINELNNLYTKNKSKAVKVAKKGLRELGVLDPLKEEAFLGIHFEKKNLILFGICFLIVLCGLFAPGIEAVLLYFFGCIFFFAGVFVGLNVPVFGLIFLCTHGGAGLFLMVLSLFGLLDDPSSAALENVFTNNPVFSDGGMPSNLMTYLGFIIAIFVVAIIYTILHSLSPVLKEDKKYTIQIMAIYFVGIFLIALLPRLFPYLFS
ncbi:MAG: hypothetical protein IKF71_01610 [Bacilli bacterium]|nr:hypothetical protein [Bacilli bacterium]